MGRCRTLGDELDLDTRCAACARFRYHDPANEGFWRDYRYWCSDLCYQRANGSEKAWILANTPQKAL